MIENQLDHTAGSSKLLEEFITNNSTKNFFQNFGMKMALASL